MDYGRRLRPGDKITAEAWNNIRAFAQGQTALSGTASAFGVQPKAKNTLQTSIVRGDVIELLPRKKPSGMSAKDFASDRLNTGYMYDIVQWTNIPYAIIGVALEDITAGGVGYVADCGMAYINNGNHIENDTPLQEGNIDYLSALPVHSAEIYAPFQINGPRYPSGWKEFWLTTDEADADFSSNVQGVILVYYDGLRWRYVSNSASAPTGARLGVVTNNVSIASGITDRAFRVAFELVEEHRGALTIGGGGTPLSVGRHEFYGYDRSNHRINTTGAVLMLDSLTGKWYTSEDDIFKLRMHGIAASGNKIYPVSSAYHSHTYVQGSEASTITFEPGGAGGGNGWSAQPLDIYDGDILDCVWTVSGTYTTHSISVHVLDGPRDYNPGAIVIGTRPGRGWVSKSLTDIQSVGENELYIPGTSWSGGLLVSKTAGAIDPSAGEVGVSVATPSAIGYWQKVESAGWPLTYISSHTSSNQTW